MSQFSIPNTTPLPQEHLSPHGSMPTKSLYKPGPGTGPGDIKFDTNSLPTTDFKRAEITDYIRMRLGDGIVDVELDKEHYEMAIKQALVKYRQRAANSTEESFAFLDLLPETQEYILPPEIQTIRAIFRRGIGSVTGTTASQFEPFASGYLNTYMLVAGRVGGLTNYELFADYQKLAMKMFGGTINFTFNPTTKKLTIVRKMPSSGHSFIRLSSMTATGTTIGSTITVVASSPLFINAGDEVFIAECPTAGFNGDYIIDQKFNETTFTIIAQNVLASTTVDNTDSFNSPLRQTKLYSTASDPATESVLLQIYNQKPDQMIFSDTYAFPWIQEYAYSFAKRIIGEARSKFAQIQGPGGGTTLNGEALKAEAVAEMETLENELRQYVDNGTPLTWITG